MFSMQSFGEMLDCVQEFEANLAAADVAGIDLMEFSDPMYDAILALIGDDLFAIIGEEMVYRSESMEYCEDECKLEDDNEDIDDCECEAEFSLYLLPESFDEEEEDVDDALVEATSWEQAFGLITDEGYYVYDG